MSAQFNAFDFTIFPQHTERMNTYRKSNAVYSSPRQHLVNGEVRTLMVLPAHTNFIYYN